MIEDERNDYLNFHYYNLKLKISNAIIYYYYVILFQM